ncbi:MAG: hypothetical protein IJ389_03970 [Clostridia bacterium]|nr:hypothetical protein [Clostridia bacterium]
MKRFKIFMVALLVISLLTSCSGDSSAVVISATDTSSANITANMYNFWASTSKANFMNTYADVTDSHEFWNSEYAEGLTYAGYLDNLVLEDIKTTAVCMMLYNEYRLSLPDSAKQLVEDEINDYITEYAGGNKSTLNSALSKYGANIDILRSVKMANAKRSLVFSHLFGEGGEKALTDSDYEQYYQNNYYRCQIIYINNKFEYVLDEDGNYTTNTDGTYVTRAITGEALDKKNAAIKAVNDGIAQGKSFEELYEEYSEEKDSIGTYTNGFYLTMGESYGKPIFYKLIGDIAETDINGTACVEYDEGTYIIKRLELDEEAWKQTVNGDFFASFETLATNEAFRLFTREHFDRLTVDETIISNYSIAKVNANNRF